MSVEPSESESSEGADVKGVFVSDGTDFTIHGLSLRFTEDGVEGGHGGVSLRVDLCRQWLRVAVGHVAAAKAARADVLKAHQEDDENALGEALHRECHAAMQAIGASAFAVDALYAGLRERMPRQSPSSSKQLGLWVRVREGLRWIVSGKEPRRFRRSSRPTRWKHIAETYRIAFRLKPDLTREVRQALRELTKYRDMAVHPPTEQRAPILRKEISRGVGWHFMAFRYHNAAACTQIVLAVLGRVLGQPDPKFPDLQPYCEGLKVAVDELADAWSKEHPDHPVRVPAS